MGQLLAAVDVGTGSARAGIFDARGRMLARAESPIALRRPAPDHVVQNSGDIWRACCAAVREARRLAEAAPADIAGIGFDATCSLVVRDRAGDPVTVSIEGGDDWDTVVWMDHRAQGEAAECTASGHPVLDHLGGGMSPEMAVPKLMWLKRHLPQSWRRAGMIFDLTDFLTWRASGNPARSQCTLTSKWTYLAHRDPGWRMDFLEAMDLGDLARRTGVPARATPIGSDLGGLTADAAEALGLTRETRVAVGLIDAHAGALGALGQFAGDPGIERHLALIAGTSSCVMGFSRQPRAAAGIWGPYLGVAFPDLWMCEGGQSASGGLLDHICRVWGGGVEPSAALHARIAARIAELRGIEGPAFAGRLHVLPDFHGNRSPLGDPSALGVISGLSMEGTFDGLCRLYWRTAVGLALGLRDILERLRENGLEVEALHVTGGQTRTAMLMELYADATGHRIVLPATPDAVLLGTAMTAAAGAGLYPGLDSAARGMSQPGTIREPDPAAPYERDWRIFHALRRQRAEIDALLAE